MVQPFSFFVAYDVKGWFDGRINIIVVTLNDDNHDDCDVSMMATTLKMKGFITAEAGGRPY